MSERPRPRKRAPLQKRASAEVEFKRGRVDGVRDDALRALVVPGLKAGVFDKIEGAKVDID